MASSDNPEGDNQITAEITNRRAFLAGVSVGTAGLAGCSALNTGGSDDNSSGGNTNDSGGTGDHERIPEIELLGFSRQLAPTYVEAMGLLEPMFDELGVAVNTKSMEIGPLFDRFNAHDFDLVLMNWIARPERLDPTLFLDSYFNSDYLDGSNYAEWENEEYDEVVQKVNATLDEEERQEAVYRAQEILGEHNPNIFLFHSDALNAINPTDYTNWTEGVDTYPYWQVWNMMEVESVSDRREIRWGTGLEPPTLNPMGTGSNTGMMVTRFVYDRLARVGPDATVEPWAAESWNVVDNQTVDVTLRNGMTFHDGEPVTVEDIKFTFEYYLEWEVPYYKSAYQVIDSVTVESDKVVRFNLSESFASLPYVTFSQIPILPQHVWDGIAEEQNLEHPDERTNLDHIGSGPYELVGFSAGGEYQYQYFEDHFMDTEVDELIWRVYGSNTAAVGDVEQGEMSLAQDLSPSLFNQASENQDLKTYNIPTHLWAALVPMTSMRPFDDRAFRTALSHAIDRDQIVEIVYQGNALPAASPIAPANEFWHNPDVPIDDGGMERAREILENAGYQWDNNGQLMMPAE